VAEGQIHWDLDRYPYVWASAGPLVNRLALLTDNERRVLTIDLFLACENLEPGAEAEVPTRLFTVVVKNLSALWVTCDTIRYRETLLKVRERLIKCG
jgi:hypothetical protein